ncbi:hypothetical protein EYF80_007925 [Liparis tanakae]|uniref:Uncharacterized protein n=1 Tax=Liparis tanakae TaxID=230148 RepID=A0A4Z2IV98_9TELE|nr:hypothetical protein EYF80_007925 [Liparis tanakae]
MAPQTRTSLSSSDDDASSEVSPQPHESSESVSQESILHCERVPQEMSSACGPALCPEQPSD